MTIYKGSRGTPVDMTALIKKNEQVRAVSNVQANARGDIIDSHNKVVMPVNQRVTAEYNAASKVRSVVTEPRVPAPAPAPQVVQPEVSRPAPKISADPVEMEELTAEERALEEEFGDDDE